LLAHQLEEVDTARLVWEQVWWTPRRHRRFVVSNWLTGV